MSKDIMLDFETLESANAGLKAAIAEFKAAAATTANISTSIGTPYGRPALQAKVADFDQAWDKKRGKLTENLEGLQGSLQGIIDSWTKWDKETAGTLAEREEPIEAASVRRVP